MEDYEQASALSSPTFEKDGSFEVDRPVGSMSISPCGRDVVLASRQGLHIIDLDSPWATPRHLPHHTPWEVADVQWSPFPSRDYWVISTSNQKALVWNLAMATPQASIEHVLHAHTRAITDINFSAHHPDILATCAVDSFVHCWDLRRPARPVLTFCDWFAGATQVKWNRQDSHIVASSHDKFLRIWDDRKGVHPLRSIKAHDTKIYGVDWNRTYTKGIVTCSLDKTIKFWDYMSQDDEPEHVIRTLFPVWRARHTPFGLGILAMPQRGDNDLHLYDCRFEENAASAKDCTPVHRFEGHEDQVKEFLWRPRGTIETGIDKREFQLVTWGADRMLRLHRVDQTVLGEVGFQKGERVDKNFNFTRKNAPYKTFRADPVKLGYDKSIGPTMSVASRAEANIESDSLGRREAISSGPTSASKGWRDGDFLTSKPRMRNGTSSRVDIDPIAWMKGVKIGKRDGGFGHGTASASSLGFKDDQNWEEFESLGEEISHVGSMFRKVDFYEVNVKNRFAKFSLYGPWGSNTSSTYLDCQLAFPNEYPISAMPSFIVQKTASIEADVVTKLAADVKTITATYQVNQRGSLEAVIRYLQGEYSVNELLAWTRLGQDDSTSVFPEDPESSSSDEENEMGGFLGNQVDDQGLTTSGVLSSSNANANVPLPKACGAVWAENGCLVCFFPPKEEKAQSLLGSLGLDKSSLLVSKGGKHVFEGFGNVRVDGRVGKTRLSSMTIVNAEEPDSESDSDGSYTSSSQSSTSSRGFSSSRHHVDTSYTLRADTLQLSAVIDESQRSNASVSFTKSRVIDAKNAITIHNFDSILPTKRALAEAYITSGSEACRHNAAAAVEQGIFEVAEAWSLLDLVVREEVPLKVWNRLGTGASFLLIAHDSHSPLTRKDSAVDLSYDSKLKGSTSGIRGSVKWGQHPVGYHHLIRTMFAHFEALADIQMLAMMSCILYRYPVISNQGFLTTKNTFLRPESRYRDPSLAHFKDIPANHEYFPSYEVASSILQPIPLPWPSTKTARFSLNPPSLGSSVGATNSDPITPFSAGMTPPSNYKPIRIGLDRSETSGHTFSTSPEQLRNPGRSNSNLASAFAASLPRPFGYITSSSSSPPYVLQNVRNSTAGSNLGGPPLTAALSTASTFGRSWTTTDEPRSARTTFESGNSEPNLSDKQPAMSIRLKHQDLFDDEGYSSTPLLGDTQEWCYQAYRHAYADMLSLWNLPISRTEMIQSENRLTSRKGSSETASIHLELSSMSIGKKANQKTSNIEDISLNLKRICADCGDITGLNTEAARSRCLECRHHQEPLICVLCDALIRGRAAPCLKCGHLLHSACLSLLVSRSRFKTGRPTCIAGCDCYCGEDVVVAVTWPKAQQNPASSAPSAFWNVDEDARTIWDDNDSAWEDAVAYESLAKNLRAGKGRYVKPKPSHIWLGRESRAKSVTG